MRGNVPSRLRLYCSVSFAKSQWEKSRITPKWNPQVISNLRVIQPSNTHLLLVGHMQSTMWDPGHKKIISSDLPNQCVCSVCECGPSQDAKRSSFPGARCALCCHQARWVTCIVILKSQNIPMWLIWENWGSEELGSSSKVIRDMAGSKLKPRSTLSPLWDPIVVFLMW